MTPDYRDILLRLIAGLGLCDHMGDVAEDVQRALDLANIVVDEWGDLSDLREKLVNIGVGSLWK